MDRHRRCGPWRETALGQVRRCNNPLLPEESSFEIARPAVATSQNDATHEEPKREPEATPALPERKTPPADERVTISERENEAARRLVDSVFGSERGESA